MFLYFLIDFKSKKRWQKAMVLKLLPDKLFMSFFSKTWAAIGSHNCFNKKKGPPKVSDFNQLDWRFMINWLKNCRTYSINAILVTFSLTFKTCSCTKRKYFLSRSYEWIKNLAQFLGKKFPFSRGDNLESTFSAAITQKSMA